VGILVQGPESEIIENNKAACDVRTDRRSTFRKTSFDKDWLVIHEDGSTFTPEDHPQSHTKQNQSTI
jgi:hypothetical protein